MDGKITYIYLLQIIPDCYLDETAEENRTIFLIVACKAAFYAVALSERRLAIDKIPVVN